MKFGRYKINRISKRFWAVLALLLLLPIVAYFLWPQSEPAPYVIDPPPGQVDEFFLDPMANAVKLDPGIEENGWYKIGNQSDERQTLPGWDPERYQNDAIQTKVYVPSKEQLDAIRTSRPSLVYQNSEGIQFYPAFVILPDNPLRPDSRTSWPSEFASGRESAPWIQLASKEVLPTGEYSVRGILYAKSNALRELSPTEVEADYPKWIPTVLLAEAVGISTAEAEAPADRRAEINIPLQYGNYELIIKSLEWASGRETRLCVGWRNISTRPLISSPADLVPFRLIVDNDGEYPLVPRDETQLSSYEQTLTSGEAAKFSYLVPLGGSGSLPADPENISISFRLPGAGYSIPVSKIEISGEDFQEPGVRDKYRWGGCGQ